MRPTPTARESRTIRQVPKVSDIMQRHFAVVSPEKPLGDVAKMILKRKVPGVVVEEDHRFRGCVSTQGLMQALVDFLNEELPVGPIRSYLDPEPPRLTEESPLMEAVNAFLKGSRAVLVLPVLRGERVVGVVTRMDVVRAAMSYFDGETDTRPGTLYLSALKESDEKPPFERR